MDQLTLSRKSSQRSSSGSMPPRAERPDSLQIFGKSLFNRRGKLRRESSDQGSIHAGEVAEPAVPALKEKDSQPFLNSMLVFTTLRIWAMYGRMNAAVIITFCFSMFDPCVNIVSTRNSCEEHSSLIHKLGELFEETKNVC